MAQWWSIALPRRGSRVRIPSRALKKKRTVSFDTVLFFFRSAAALRSSNVFAAASVRAEPTSTGCRAPSRAERKLCHTPKFERSTFHFGPTRTDIHRMSWNFGVTPVCVELRSSVVPHLYLVFLLFL